MRSPESRSPNAGTCQAACWAGIAAGPCSPADIAAGRPGSTPIAAPARPAAVRRRTGPPGSRGTARAAPAAPAATAAAPLAAAGCGWRLRPARPPCTTAIWVMRYCASGWVWNCCRMNWLASGSIGGNACCVVGTLPPNPLLAAPPTRATNFSIRSRSSLVMAVHLVQLMRQAVAWPTWRGGEGGSSRQGAQARRFDGGAAIHHRDQARRPGAGQRRPVDHAQLQPDAARAQPDRLVHHRVPRARRARNRSTRSSGAASASVADHATARAAVCPASARVDRRDGRSHARAGTPSRRTTGRLRAGGGANHAPRAGSALQQLRECRRPPGRRSWANSSLSGAAWVAPAFHLPGRCLGKVRASARPKAPDAWTFPPTRLPSRTLILRLHGVLGGAGLRHPAALRCGDGRRHLPSRHHAARPGAGALACGLRAALRAARATGATA